MKVLVYNGPRDVNVVEVPDAKIERSTDVVKQRPIVYTFPLY